MSTHPEQAPRPSLPPFDPDRKERRADPGLGEDVACVRCGAVALDTGLECSECGHDNYEAVTGKPFGPQAPAPQPEAAEPVPSADRDALEWAILNVRRWLGNNCTGELPRVCIAALATLADEVLSAPTVQPMATIRDFRTVDPTERSDQAVQRAVGGCAVQPVALSDAQIAAAWKARPRTGITSATRAIEFVRHVLATPSVESVERDAALHTFLNAAAGEGLVLDGIDAADLYIELFPARYAAALAERKEMQP